MFSNIVTAAKGLFGRQDSSEPNLEEHSPQNMVTATRRGKYSASPSEVEESSTVGIGDSPVLNGKRKIGLSQPEVGVEEQSTKRRKKKASNGVGSKDAKLNGIVNEQQILAVQVDNSTTSSVADGPTSDGLGNDIKTSEKSQETPKPSAKSAHTRFGSEEPVPKVLGDAEPAPETVQGEDENDDEESDDDEAPEALDNTMQLQKMRDAARKEELAKQRLEKQKKEKRRERDQLLKSQAVGRVDIKAPKASRDVYANASARPDELRSESSATLQGSTKAPLRALPALLPDEILNAEPAIRPPTPPAEDETSTKKVSKKMQFLEKVERRPKDVKVGGGATSIRVFEYGNGNANAGAKALPPKCNKDSKRVRETWMAGKGKPASGSSLRRTTGSSGFLRR